MFLRTAVCAAFLASAIFAPDLSLAQANEPAWPAALICQAGVQSYFARRYANDMDFRDAYSVPGINWGGKPPLDPSAPESVNRAEWERRRFEFLRFYGVRASGNFSLGCHDEWSIFRLLNKRRRMADAGTGRLDGDVGVQIAGFFDGTQIDPASTEAPLTRGYALKVDD